jgi:hypothetical protein
MLNRYKEERSAQRVVPYLSHGTFASLRIWLRGLQPTLSAALAAGCLRARLQWLHGNTYLPR